MVRVLFMILFVIGVILAVNGSLHLLRQPSDMAVAAGVAILIVTGFAVYVVARKAFKW